MRRISIKNKVSIIKTKSSIGDPNIVRNNVNKEALPISLFVGISTYGRNGMLSKMLDSILGNPYVSSILVIDDNSPSPFVYSSNNVNVIRHEMNYGKRKYWLTITEIMQKFSNTDCSHFLQLDDDFVLTDDFFERLSTHIKRHRESVIKLHLDERHGRKMWGYNEWVDGGTCYPRSLLRKIGFAIPMIPSSRWHKSPLLSSGVWQKMTELIHVYKYRIFSPHKSLVVHEGHVSMMNPTARKETPIITKNI